MTSIIAQAGDAPAGGAPLVQIALAGAASLLAFVPLAMVVVRERAGRPTFAGRFADRLAARRDVPRWLALPMHLQVASITAAGIGVYWDVPWHADLGRDEGPLANPAHYFILAGLLGVFAAGVLSAALATKDLPARVVRLGPGWRVPAGSVLMMIGGVVALSGFPLDDGWHRLFGQDVTEWGPTHVMMIGGAVASLLGTMLLVAEASQLRGRVSGRVDGLRRTRLRLAALWLLGVSVFGMEYEIGVPQYPMIAQVVLLAVAGTWALVYARATFGPGGALLAVAVYLLVRVLFLLLTGPLLGRTAAHFALYLVPAVLVELLALIVPVHRSQMFGSVAGALVGSAGLLAEAAWTHVFLPLPWPADLWIRYAGYGVLAGVGAGLIVGWQLSRLDEASRPDKVGRPVEVSRPVEVRRPRLAAEHGLGLLGGAAVLLALTLAVPRADDQRLSGQLTVQNTEAGNAIVTVRLSDPAAPDGAVWFHTLSWQGGTRVLVPFEPAGDGAYRTGSPVPVQGSAKTLVRLHLPDDYLVALPVYLPADPAIPVEETPAASGVTRQFESERHILQREARDDLPGWLWAAGYGSVFLIYALVFVAIARLYSVAAGPGRAGRRHDRASTLQSSDSARS